jgi:hypothetical protein
MHQGSEGGTMTAGASSSYSDGRMERESMSAIRRHPLVTFFVLTYLDEINDEQCHRLTAVVLRAHNV